MWRVEFEPDNQRLSLRLSGRIMVADMRRLSRAHADALSATGGQPFSVLMDLRGSGPLDSDCSRWLSDIKRVSAELEGCRGRAVLVDSPTVAMQQHNDSLEDPHDIRELITLRREEAARFLGELMGDAS